MISYPFTFYLVKDFNYSFNSAISAYNKLILLLTSANVLAISISIFSLFYHKIILLIAYLINI